MRLSTDPDDPGYQAWMALQEEGPQYVVVLVNGEKQIHCVTVDDEIGCALVYEIGPDGRVVLEGDELKIKELRGTVQIVIEAVGD